MHLVKAVLRVGSSFPAWLCVIGVLTSTPLLHAQDKPAFPPVSGTLYLPNDTLGVFYEGNQTFVTLTSLPADTDSTYLQVRSDLLLFSGTDTVTIRPSDQPALVVASSPLDTILLLVFFDRDKREILRQYPDFRADPTDSLPRFTYADAVDSNLVLLRQTFNLDSVAGHGDETSKLLNLLQWAHQVARHDGNSKNPQPANAMNIIAVARAENRGVNCRMLATVLNEACLAEGFKSRHLTCMPADVNDQDCHVVDMVWSKTLRKWIYLDPTFQAYFTGQDGSLLGPDEIRRDMIVGDSLVVNDNLNWNGQPHSKKRYLAYMAKNLFRFSCPVGSEFGYESREGKRDWLYLDPVGYNSVAVQDSTRLPVKYVTHNAGYFWAAP